MAPTNHTLATILLLCCALSVALLPSSAGRLQSTCAVGTTSIRIQEEFVDEDGGEVVYCRGTATVNKCEGTCISQSTPSIVSPTGYSKDCSCCREERLVSQDVILTECYDSAGNALLGRSYPVQVPEPDSCRCQRCSL
ncbi:partner of bursicon-like [Patiria miniata]|uniref:Bursicon beta n=1 Tax=Patiria miniata TaxID=46514 RepID=A0A913Z2D5_PATMI|nr:partner of bursicon-like [Patiria miniata]